MMRRWQWLGYAIGMSCLACAHADRASLGQDASARRHQAALQHRFAETEARLAARIKAFPALTFSGAVTGAWFGRRATYQMAGAVRLPATFRLDLFDPALGLVFSVAAVEGTLWWYDPRGEKAYRAAATAEQLLRLVKLPWAPAELARVLAGLPPRADDALQSSIWSGSPPWPAETVLFKDIGGKALASVRFAEYRPLGKFAVPYAVEIEQQKPRVTLGLRYDRIEAVRDPAALNFLPPIPEGTDVYAVE